MDFFNKSLDANIVQSWQETIDEWVFVFALAFLGFELLHRFFKKQLSWNYVGDSFSNFVVFTKFVVVLFLTGGFYVSAFYFASAWAPFGKISVTPFTILLCLVAVDLAYYLEHRVSHRVGIGWATHLVHHSSPHYNLSVAFRFGPLDGFVPIVFMLPLVLIGFDPLIVFATEAFILTYQTFLHTQLIGKLPRPIEFIFNTPSHHRVHHGSNPHYIDKNYGGLFIVWDRIFGTFAQEEEAVVFGLTTPIHSINPFVIFWGGLYQLGKRMILAKNLIEALGYFFLPPDWQPKKVEPANHSKNLLESQ